MSSTAERRALTQGGNSQISQKNLANKKAWSNGGSLFSGTTRGDVHLQCDFESAPEFYTAQFSIAPITSVQQFCMAEVLWSVEGVTNRRLISVVNGASISGCGQAVSIRCFDLSAIGGGPEEYQVNIAVTKGTRGSSNQPPVLGGAADPEGNIGRFASPMTVLLPATATANRNLINDSGTIAAYLAIAESNVVGGPLSTEDILVEYFAGLNGTGGRVFVGNLSYCNFWAPVPPGARSLSVTNRRTVIPDENVQYSLMWGVDG